MQPPPAPMRDAHYAGAARLGHGVGYLYPHAYPNHWVDQEYLPDALRDAQFCQPTKQGLEARLWRELIERRTQPAGGSEPI